MAIDWDEVYVFENQDTKEMIVSFQGGGGFGPVGSNQAGGGNIGTDPGGLPVTTEPDPEPGTPILPGDEGNEDGGSEGGTGSGGEPQPIPPATPPEACEPQSCAIDPNTIFPVGGGGTVHYWSLDSQDQRPFTEALEWYRDPPVTGATVLARTPLLNANGQETGWAYTPQPVGGSEGSISNYSSVPSGDVDFGSQFCNPSDYIFTPDQGPYLNKDYVYNEDAYFSFMSAANSRGIPEYEFGQPWIYPYSTSQSWNDLFFISGEIVFLPPQSAAGSAGTINASGQLGTFLEGRTRCDVAGNITINQNTGGARGQFKQDLCPITFSSVGDGSGWNVKFQGKDGTGFTNNVENASTEEFFQPFTREPIYLGWLIAIRSIGTGSSRILKSAVQIAYSAEGNRDRKFTIENYGVESFDPLIYTYGQPVHPLAASMPSPSVMPEFESPGELLAVSRPDAGIETADMLTFRRSLINWTPADYCTRIT